MIFLRLKYTILLKGWSWRDRLFHPLKRLNGTCLCTRSFWILLQMLWHSPNSTKMFFSCYYVEIQFIRFLKFLYFICHCPTALIYAYLKRQQKWFEEHGNFETTNMKRRRHYTVWKCKQTQIYLTYIWHSKISKQSLHILLCKTPPFVVPTTTLFPLIQKRSI